MEPNNSFKILSNLKVGAVLIDVVVVFPAVQREDTADTESFENLTVNIG